MKNKKGKKTKIKNKEKEIKPTRILPERKAKMKFYDDRTKTSNAFDNLHLL